MVLLSDFRHEVTNKNNRIKKDLPMSLAHFMNPICPLTNTPRDYLCNRNLGAAAYRRTL